MPHQNQLKEAQDGSNFCGRMIPNQELNSCPDQ